MQHPERLSNNGSTTRWLIATLWLALIMLPGGPVQAQPFTPEPPPYRSPRPMLRGTQSEGAEDQSVIMQIAPNPFTAEFTLRYQGAPDPSHIYIIDMMGRVVETRESVDADQELVLGSELLAGAYFVQIVQGEEHRTMMIHKVK